MSAEFKYPMICTGCGHTSEPIPSGECPNCRCVGLRKPLHPAFSVLQIHKAPVAA